MQEKMQFRKRMIKDLQKISTQQYDYMSHQIAQHLYKDDTFLNATHIGITISKFPEVDTYPIIRSAWKLGKKVSVPKCLPENRQMIFRMIGNFNQLETVYSNLFEPIEEVTKQVDRSEIDLLIVPGVAFSHNGYRLGFGGGYYDRFLQNYSGKTVSLAFSTQLHDDLPVEDHDLAVQKIITNEGIVIIDE